MIGLYLNPSHNALVLSVGEKSSIQALERARGYVHTSSGKIVQGMKSTYKRHGTVNLFAALEVATGVICGKTTQTKKRADFQAFMGEVGAKPAGLQARGCSVIVCTRLPTGDHCMNDSSAYTPPSIWFWNKENGGRFASINRPTASATHEMDLPVGRHPLQLYSLATPNGVKVTVMLEELLALGHVSAEYDAWLVRINDGDQFGSGFVAVNPNSKIPALLDRSGPTPVRVFESGAILLYLAEKFGAFLPANGSERAECLSWLFWQMGSAPFLGGGFGHFYAYAPTKIEYAIDRYAMEVKRQLDVLDRRLAESPYLAGDDYTIADMAVWPWYGTLAKGQLYAAGEFLQVQAYTHILRWTDQIAQRPAVQRGRMVNRTWGEPSSQLHERHDAGDFDTQTQDKLAELR